MNWLKAGVVGVAAVVAAGCGPAEGDGVDDPVEAYRAPAPQMEPFDYRKCEAGAVVVDCEDGSCVDEGGEQFFELFMLAVETYELDEYVFVSWAGHDEIRGGLVLEYQTHVGWLRASSELRLATDASYDEQVAAIEDALGDLELPLTLARPADVVAELVDCVPQVDFNPCTAFKSPREASVSYIVNQGGAVEWRARVDTKTGSVIQCGVD